MRILCVYAHPDDESFGPAAALAQAARRGASIHCLTFTRGEKGATHLEPAPSREELARLREADLRAAAELIGIGGLELFDYPDGALAGKPLEGHVMATIERVRPEVVLTFGPAGITRHEDHVAVHEAAFAAFHRALLAGLGVRELYYDAVPREKAAQFGIENEPDGQPNAVFEVTTAAREAQLAAMRVHARHMSDARERLKEMEREPAVATFHRAWPPGGAKGFLEEPRLVRGQEVVVAHEKPWKAGRPVRMRGWVDGFVGDRLAVARRFKSPGLLYDGLEGARQRPGDRGLIELCRDAWVSRRRYLRAGGEPIGELFNAQTPTLLHDGGAAYVDLEVDVARVQGRVLVQDLRELEAAEQAGHIAPPLADLARWLADELARRLRAGEDDWDVRPPIERVTPDVVAATLALEARTPV